MKTHDVKVNISHIHTNRKPKLKKSETLRSIQLDKNLPYLSIKATNSSKFSHRSRQSKEGAKLNLNLSYSVGNDIDIK